MFVRVINLSMIGDFGMVLTIFVFASKFSRRQHVVTINHIVLQLSIKGEKLTEYVGRCFDVGNLILKEHINIPPSTRLLLCLICVKEAIRGGDASFSWFVS